MMAGSPCTVLPYHIFLGDSIAYFLEIDPSLGQRAHAEIQKTFRETEMSDKNKSDNELACL